MPIRISGLTSGLDTESIVGALVSAYSYKKDKYTKAQTKLTWKQDAWKTLNSKVYNLYTNVGNMRYSSNYALRKTSISDSSKATVTASGSAIIGTQTLEIKQLAKTAYLTGGKLDNSVTSDTKLSDLGFKTNAASGDGSIQVKTATSTTKIVVDGNTTVNEFINKLNGAGVQASYDEKNKRIFVSGNKSGSVGDFSLSANNSMGLQALSSLKLLSDSEVASYSEDSGITNLLSKTFTFTDSEGTENIITKDKQGFQDYIYEVAKMHNKLAADPTDTEAAEYLADGSKNAKFAAYLEERYGSGVWNISYADAGTMADEIYSESVYDVHGADETASNISTVVNAIRDAYVNLEKAKSIDNDEAVSDMMAALDEVKAKYGDWKDYIEQTFGWKNSEDADGEDAYSNFWIQSDNQELVESVQYKVATAADAIINDVSIESNARKIDGQDAEFIINEETYTSNSNSITVNGLTIEAFAETTTALNITVSNDTDGLYDKIKDFLTSYNSLINEMQKLYNADSAKDYEPLTDDEKAEMSETEIEKWEQKIKDSLLRRDGTLSSLISTLTTSMLKTYTVNGEKMSWSTLGIGTLGSLRAEKNENYAYHIDGDSEDSYTSGKTDKLRTMIAEDPDAVIDFMKQLTTDLYTQLDAKMKSTAVKSVYTVYNDKEMASEYSNYSSLIKQWSDRVKDMEDSYYKKFSKMESALAKLQNNSSSLTSMLGGG